jgi:hypothetical protein
MEDTLAMAACGTLFGLALRGVYDFMNEFTRRPRAFVLTLLPGGAVVRSATR